MLARVVSAVIVAAVGWFALVLVLADAADEGPSQSFDWLPLIESTINVIVFAAIAGCPLGPRPSLWSAVGPSGAAPPSC